MAWINYSREREEYFETLMEHVRIKYVSGDCLKKLEMFGKKKIYQSDSNKHSRSGHDEVLLARIKAMDQRKNLDLFSYDFEVKLKCFE